MSIRWAVVLGTSIYSTLLSAAGENPLLGCWQCSSGGSPMALRFEASHYYMESEPLAYQLLPGYIQIPEPDGYSRYPYRIENGQLTILMDDTPPLVCQRKSCAGSAKPQR